MGPDCAQRFNVWMGNAIGFLMLTFAVDRSENGQLAGEYYDERW